jgi:hypothetical protein
LLRGLAPAFADRRRQRMAKLAAMLGDLQNLYVLRAQIGTAPLDLTELDREVQRQSVKLRRKCLRLGNRLFAEKPSKVCRRWKGYVEDWLAVEKLVRGK